jgi:hypothetical protein
MKKNSEETLCPICGSKNVTSQIVSQLVGVIDSAQESVSVFHDSCQDCGATGDFGDRNSDIIEQGIKRSEERMVEGIIRFLSSLGITMAYMERVLGLPQRTAMRWKAGEHSASAVALLQLIRTYPWLLKVAEHGFEKRYAQTVLLEQAGSVIHSALQNMAAATQAAIPMAASVGGVAVLFFSGGTGARVISCTPQSDSVNLGSVSYATG